MENGRYTQSQTQIPAGACAAKLKEKCVVVCRIQCEELEEFTAPMVNR